MGWRENLLPASLDGVEFAMEGERGKDGGRRVTVHEFGDVDGARGEDSGRSPSRYQVTAYFVGDDYQVGRDDLEAVLEAPGPHTFTHPTRGIIEGLILEGGYRTSEDQTSLGKASITFTLVEADEPSPLIVEASAAKVSDAIFDLDLATQAEFVDRFDVTDYADTAIAAVDRVTDKIDAALDIISTQLQTAGQLVDIANQAKSAIEAVASAPDRFISALKNFLAAAMNLIPDLTIDNDRNPNYQIAQSIAGVFPGDTTADEADIEQLEALPDIPQKSAAIASIQATIAAQEALSLSALAGKITTVLIPTADAALELVATIDDQAAAILTVQYADVDDVDGVPISPDLSDAVKATQNQILAFIGQAAVGLPSLGTYTVPASAPLVVIAWWIFGQIPDFEDKIEQLLALNPSPDVIDDPSMVVAGTELIVLVEAA